MSWDCTYFYISTLNQKISKQYFYGLIHSINEISKCLAANMHILLLSPCLSFHIYYCLIIVAFYEIYICILLKLFFAMNSTRSIPCLSEDSHFWLCGWKKIWGVLIFSYFIDCFAALSLAIFIFIQYLLPTSFYLLHEYIKTIKLTIC